MLKTFKNTTKKQLYAAAYWFVPNLLPFGLLPFSAPANWCTAV